jgi:acid stress-induced BolA-like protein IbaG/YrbA
MSEEKLPRILQRLVDTLKQELGAEVEVERVNDDGDPDRFRLGVVSQRFASMPDLKRQDLLWGIVDRLMSPRDSMVISIILAFSPEELEPASERKPQRR